MKIRCVICKIEKELSDGCLTDITKIVSKNLKAKSTDYLRLLNIMCGPTCQEEKDHIFIFHEEFDNAMSNLFKEYTQSLECGGSIDGIISKLQELTGTDNIELWF